jgi:4-amino-4-deoxy-L-arabinose transferase-like glycosyltransferase
MIERGDYVTPMFNYEPRINKPALSYWIVAGLYHAIGVSVTAERVAIAGAALLMMAATFWLARTTSPYASAAVLAALGLAANPRFFMFSRRILIDVLVAALMTLTLLFFTLSEQYPHRRRRFLFLMYVSVGFGMLAKGPVAAVLPALVFAAYLLYYRELPRLKAMMLPLGVLVILAIVSPWYAALYRQNGWAPIQSFFMGENLERYTTTFGPGGRGLFFYLPVVFSDGLPWSVLLPVGVAVWWRERRERAADPRQRIRTLLLFWIATIVGFFTLSSTKQDLYILPIAPAVAVLGADLLSRGAIDGVARWSGWLWHALRATGLLVAGAGVLVLYVFAQAGPAYVLDGARLFGGLVIAGGLVTIVLAGRRSVWAATALVAALVAVNWTLVLRVLPSFERYKPVVALAETIRAHARSGDVVVDYETPLPSLVFYLRRRVETVSSPEHLRQIVQATSGTVFSVMPEDRYEELKAEMGPSACVLERRPTFNAKLREMIARRPPPAVVLASTRCK